jgi:hypothetical protein
MYCEGSIIFVAFARFFVARARLEVLISILSKDRHLDRLRTFVTLSAGGASPPESKDPIQEGIFEPIGVLSLRFAALRMTKRNGSASRFLNPDQTLAVRLRKA